MLRSVFIVIISCFVSQCFFCVASSAAKSVCYTDFEDISKESTYIDKTLFIREFLKDVGHKIVATAPRGFGKSANLHMLKAFLQLEMDRDGNKITAMKDGTKPIRDTENFKLFQQLKIREEKELVDKHFGKYPVIHMDLRAVVRFSYFNETQDFFKECQHETFMEHRYLENSEKLYEDEREFVKMWCADNYTELDLGSFMPCLETLAKLLFKHFGRTRVIFLIDHYDSPIYNCVTDPDTPADVFRYVINQIQMMFNKIKDDFYVDTFFITGVSQIEASHFSNARVIKRYEFLNEHRLVPYFGLVEDEVFDLLGRYTIEVNNDLFEKVQLNYGGYLSANNVTVHNLWAILQYLHKQKLDHVWARGSDVLAMTTVLKIPDIRQKMEKMLKGLPVVMELKKSFSYDDLHILRDLLVNPQQKGHLFYTTLFFSFLFEQGYLAYDPEVKSAISDSRRYLIPNEEVKEYFVNKMNS